MRVEPAKSIPRKSEATGATSFTFVRLLFAVIVVFYYRVLSSMCGTIASELLLLVVER